MNFVAHRMMCLSCYLEGQDILSQCAPALTKVLKWGFMALQQFLSHEERRQSSSSLETFPLAFFLDKGYSICP